MSRVLPTEEELTTFLTAAGVTIPEGLDLELELDAAVEWWEDTTGWHPFFQDGVVEDTLRYDRPLVGKKLDLGSGFLSVSAVVVNTELDGTGGEALTLLDDYRPVYWQDETQEGWIVALNAVAGWGAGWRNISVTGLRGCQTDLDAKVYKAVLSRAALTAYGTATGSLGKVSRIKQGPHEQQFETQKELAPGALGTIVTGWDVYSQEVAADYVKELV